MPSRAAGRLCVLLLLLASGTPGSAHHGVADDVDLTGATELEGTITRVEWVVNPHVLIHLSSETDNGFNQRWVVQADSPNALLREGINRQSFPAMQRIRLRVYPSLSSPCNTDCMAYGFEYNPGIGASYILHQEMYELVHQLN